ncbi:hypothetical protein ACSSS7_003952 [Eimeria intestinalis]
MQPLRRPGPSWPLTGTPASSLLSSASSSNGSSNSNSSDSSNSSSDSSSRSSNSSSSKRSSSRKRWAAFTIHRSPWGKQRPLLVAACCIFAAALLLQQQQVAADDPFTLIGDWSTSTLRQLQEALAAPFGILRGQQHHHQQQQEQQRQQQQLPPPYVAATAGGALSSLLPFPQPSSGATLAPPTRLQLQQQEQQQQQQQQQLGMAWGPAVAASNAVAAAERALHQVQLVEGSLRDFTTSLAKQVALREQQREQQQKRQQVGEGEQQQHADGLWEPHECLQPHAFATSVLRAFHPQGVEEAIREARSLVAQMLAAAQDENSNSSTQQQQVPPSPPYKDLQNPIPSEFLSRPSSLLFAVPVVQPSPGQATPPVLLHQQQQQQQDASELHAYLEGRLAELNTRSREELASVEAQLQRLFGWADVCSMAALAQLNGEFAQVAETVDVVLRANDAFAVEAAALLQRLLQMLGDWPRTGRETAAAAAALLRVSRRSIKLLQRQQQELQQQRAPVLKQLEKTRSKLGLLAEAAAGIVRQGSGDEELLQGRGPFCQRLLQQRKRLQPPRSEDTLLHAHQVHQQKLMEGLLSLADNLQAFVSAARSAAAARAAEGQQESSCALLGTTQQQRLLLQQAAYVARLPSAASGLRGGGLQLGSSIQLTMMALQELGGGGASAEETAIPLSRLQEETVPSQELLELPPAVLLERIERQQRRAVQQAETLVAAAAALEATAAARRATSRAAAATTTAAELLEVAEETSEAAAAAARDEDWAAVDAHAQDTSEETTTEEEDEEEGETIGPVAEREAAHAAAAGDEDTAREQQQQQQQQQQHGAVAALEAAASGLVEGAEALASDVRRRLGEAVSAYGKARQLTAAAVALLARSSQLKACRFKERERQEQRLLAEGVLEQKRLQLRRQLLTLAAYAAAGPRRTSP